MEPDGFLVLGAAETVVGLTDAFKPYPDKRGLYRPNECARDKGAGGLVSAADARRRQEVSDVEENRARNGSLQPRL